MTSIDNDYYYKNYQSLEFHLGLPSLKKSIEVHFKRLRVFLLYFYHVFYEVTVWEKNIGRSTSYSCRTNTLTEFNHFMEEELDTVEDWTTQANHFYESMGFRNLHSACENPYIWRVVPEKK